MSISQQEFLQLWSHKLNGVLLIPFIDENPDPDDLLAILDSMLDCMYSTVNEPDFRLPKDQFEEYERLGKALELFKLLDDANYFPANEFLDCNRIPDFNALRKTLKKNPWIRTQKPTKQRLKIHGSDMIKLEIEKKKLSANDLCDIPAATADAILEIERQKLAERSQKRREA